MTISEALKIIVVKLQSADIVSPVLDAEVLLASVLNVERYKLTAYSEKKLTREEQIQFESHISRRLHGEPVAYILQQKEFYSLQFHVDERVLIPRPETELLVDLSIYYAENGAGILDLGTGSGAIAVSIKYTRPDLHVTATDISKDALEIASKNCEVITGKGSISFLHGNLYEPLQGRKFDIIVSNPPYISPHEKDELQQEVLREPHIALFAEDNGMAVIREIIIQSRNMLNENGIIMTEISPGINESVIDLGKKSDYDVSIINDYSGLPRIAVFK